MKDILNSRQNRSKNKLVGENAVTSVHGRYPLLPMDSCQSLLFFRLFHNCLSRVYSSNWPMKVKWAPFCNFRGPFFKRKKGRKRWGRLKVFELIGTDCSMRKRVGLAGRFAAILKYSGQLRKPGLELLQNPGCLSGEIMTQTKKRKAIETVTGYKSSK